MIENPKTKKVSYYRKPTDMTTGEWQIALRQQFSQKQNFDVKNIGTHKVFSDFLVYNPESGNEYKVAIRSYEFGDNFCECLDFKKNGLGTCKHIEYVLSELKEDVSNDDYWEKGYSPSYSSISLKYGLERKVAIRIGIENRVEIIKLTKPYFDKEGILKKEMFFEIGNIIHKIRQLNPDFRIYNDALDFIIEERSHILRKHELSELFPEGINSSYFDSIIKANLYPYQKEGVLKTLRAGRAIIADEMGLGKTIQAIAATEVYSKHFNVNKVLIICPTSLKYQWKSEINKFTDKSVQVIEGQLDKRKPQYESNSFYHIASYGVGLNDIKYLNEAEYDLVILDEAQRIKNWKTKTAKNLKKLKSQYAIVLTGTPLENRLDELHSLVEFINPYRLGSLFRFLDKHQLLDEESGKLLGYKDLNHIKEVLDDILIRRSKKEIIQQLPDRIDKTYFVDLTKEQWDIHEDYNNTVARLSLKWRKFGFLSEEDRKRLLMSLACMRMVSDSTFILDQKTRYDKKIDELIILLKEIFVNSDDKIVIFSQWERMTRLVARELEKMNINYEYLHGGIPSNKRKQLLDNFREEEASRVFLSTDAGGVGLNLQSANVIINLDLPWNPAILEQRIARVHRLGQQKKVNVINFVSKGSIENKILGVLDFKQSVFSGVLDGGDDQVIMDESKFSKLMKTVDSLNEVEVNNHVSEAKEDKKFETSQKTSSTESGDKKQKERKQESEAPKQETANEINELFTAGANLFEKLGQTFGKIQSGEINVDDFVNTDKQSGKTTLNIPVENKEVVEKTISNIANLFQAFMSK